jgi:hypothetical protein
MVQEPSVLFSTPGVQTALVVHNTDGSWTMIY